MKVIQECGSLSEWQEIQIHSSTQKNVVYVVTIPPWEGGEAEAVCECPSFEYRGRCRHQREALQFLCHWSELDGRSQTQAQKKKHICPDCGNKTNVVVLEGE